MRYLTQSTNKMFGITHTHTHIHAITFYCHTFCLIADISTIFFFKLSCRETRGLLNWKIKNYYDDYNHLLLLTKIHINV